MPKRKSMKRSIEGYKIFQILLYKRNMEHTDIETIYKVHFKQKLTYDAKSNKYEIFWICWNSEFDNRV
jgi:hypothetical protein